MEIKKELINLLFFLAGITTFLSSYKAWELSYLDIPEVKKVENRFVMNYDSTYGVGLGSGQHSVMMVHGENAKGTQSSVLPLASLSKFLDYKDQRRLKDSINEEGISILTLIDARGHGHLLGENIYTRLSTILQNKREERTLWLKIALLGMIGLLISIASLAKRLKKTSVVVFFIFTPFAIQGQHSSQVYRVDTAGVYTVNKTHYATDIYTYPDNFKILKSSTPLNEFNFNAPEQVILALLSAKDNKWADRFVEEGYSEKYYKKDVSYEMFSSISKYDFYIKPILLIRFTSNIDSFYLMRYKLVDNINNRNMDALSKIRKYNDGFRISGPPIDANIAFALTYIKKNILVKIFNKDLDISGFFGSDIYLNKEVVLNRLGNTFSKWMSDREKYSEIIKTYTDVPN